MLFVRKKDCKDKNVWYTVNMAKHKIKKSKKRVAREFGVDLVNKFDEDDFFDDCGMCQFTKKIQQEGRSPTVGEMKIAFNKAKENGSVVWSARVEDKDDEDERKFMKERGFEYIGTADDFKMPDWMDCTWRRVPCDKDECKICGRIKQDRFRHIMKGEDPDSTESMFEDIGKNFKEALGMIRRDAEERGIDITNLEDIEEPPKPEKFPLYNKVSRWNVALSEVAGSAEGTEYSWFYTEATADLLWYKNTLLAKTYRQLCNRWEQKRGDEYTDVDLQYTKYVLEECIKILKRSLVQLSELDSPQKGGLTVALTHLSNLEKQIIKI